jgi:hypothetical protein
MVKIIEAAQEHICEQQAVKGGDCSKFEFIHKIVANIS